MILIVEDEANIDELIETRLGEIVRERYEFEVLKYSLDFKACSKQEYHDLRAKLVSQIERDTKAIVMHLFQDPQILITPLVRESLKQPGPSFASIMACHYKPVYKGLLNPEPEFQQRFYRFEEK